MCDNYWKNCPPKMQDGRFLQDFRTSTTRNLQTKHILGIKNEDQYRKFLQNNAVSIMNEQWNYLENTQSCFPNACIHVYPTVTNTLNNLNEMSVYNAVRTNKVRKGQPGYPECKKMKSFRLTDEMDNWKH